MTALNGQFIWRTFGAKSALNNAVSLTGQGIQRKVRQMPALFGAESLSALSVIGDATPICHEEMAA